jgi:hypothetical protein
MSNTPFSEAHPGGTDKSRHGERPAHRLAAPGSASTTMVGTRRKNRVHSHSWSNQE